MRAVQLECIIYCKKDDSYQFLLLKRIKSMGGFWQPPCGGLEEGDKSNLNAAFREIYEETGIQKKNILTVVENVHHFTINRHYLTQKPIPPIEEFVFGFEVSPDQKVDLKNNIPPEHEDYRWVSFKDAINLLKWDDNKVAFKKLNSNLISKNKLSSFDILLP